MDKRACIYVRIGWLALAAMVVFVLSTYVAQSRFVHIGFCPPSVTGGPSLLVFDSLRPQSYCLPLPMPDKAEVAPKPSPDDKKVGV